MRVGDARVLGDDVTFALEDPARGEEPLDPHRAAGVDAGRRDADLGSQAEAEPVAEAC